MAERDTLPVGMEWRTFHRDNAMKIAPEKRRVAVEFISKELSEPSRLEIIHRGKDDAEWWSGAHFGWGMAMRNALRQNNLGEKELGVDNLDDYYVGLVELAVGLTTDE